MNLGKYKHASVNNCVSNRRVLDISVWGTWHYFQQTLK
jgi:hypothetical protein